jgi:hypothetical protein
MKRFHLWLLLSLALIAWTVPAQAARQFTITQTSPVAPVQFDMGTTQTVTYSITNTSNGGNAGERIYEMRFRLPGTGTVFSSSTAAPAGWTRSSFSTTSVTFRANDWTTSMPSGSSLSFSLVMVLRTASADANETLQDARASYTLDTNFSNGVTRSGRSTLNNPGSWALKSLQVTSFQTVDIATGLPVSTILAGQGFRLVMTVRNISNATQSSIISSPNPPTAVKTGTVTQVVTSTVYSPNPLTLAPGASGTITFTYTTVASNNGTITFTAYARNGGNTATSRTATSNLLTVSGGSFIANVTVSTAFSPPCAYVGQTFTVSMDLTNSYSYGITGITPTLSPTVGGIVTLTAGPTPVTQSIGASSTGTFQWTYQITGGNDGDTLQFTGSATGTASAPGSGTKTTPVATSSLVKRGGFSPTVDPLDTNADSTNADVTFNIIHKGCGVTKVQSVSIAIPGGWAYSGDGYALTDETWNPPTGAGPVVFSAPTLANQITLGGTGNFSLILDTPTTTGSYTFTLVITDDLGASVTQPTTNSITINPFNSGTPSLNSTIPGTWREEFR